MAARARCVVAPAPGSLAILTPRARTDWRHSAPTSKSAIGKVWGAFAGSLVERPAKPTGIPASYVMKLFDLKLDCGGGSIGAQCPWNLVTMRSVTLTIPSSLWRLASVKCSLLGVSRTTPGGGNARSPPNHLKMHISIVFGSDRARDLADLRLLDARGRLEFAVVRATCNRLFAYRRIRSWPSSMFEGGGWVTHYTEAA